MVDAKRLDGMEMKFVKHNDCSQYLLNKICVLKKQHWNYPIKEQLKWIHLNLKPEDVHVCILDRGNLIAYANLLDVEYKLNDNINRHALGIGNVCVDKKHLKMHFGFLIIQLATFYIRQQNTKGFLICKDELVSFYEKCNWIKFEGELVIVNYNKHCNLLSTSSVKSNKITLRNSF